MTEEHGGCQIIRSKKKGGEILKKNNDNKKQQKVDFRGQLNDSKPKIEPNDQSSSSFNANVKLIDQNYNLNGTLAHFKSALEKINPTHQNNFTSEGEEKYSALGSLTYNDVGKHVYTLRTEYIPRHARPLIQKLMVHPSNKNMFNAPVDPIALCVPNYFEMITNPMDLGLVRSRVHRGYYKSIEECFCDIELVFQNALDFNSVDHPVHKQAEELMTEFYIEVASIKDKCVKETEKKMSHSCNLCCGALCLVCGEKCLKFEGPVLVCHGSCNSKVKRNSTYYITTDSGMLWCQKCYNSLNAIIVPDYPSPESETGVAPLLKKHLLKRKSDEEVAEPWVECDDCGYWVHQICVLYNDLQLSSNTSNVGVGAAPVATKGYKFSCPLCRIDKCARADAGEWDVSAPTSTDKRRKGFKPVGAPKKKRSSSLSSAPTTAHHNKAGALLTVSSDKNQRIGSPAAGLSASPELSEFVPRTNLCREVSDITTDGIEEQGEGYMFMVEAEEEKAQNKLARLREIIEISSTSEASHSVMDLTSSLSSTGEDEMDVPAAREVMIIHTSSGSDSEDLMSAEPSPLPLTESVAQVAGTLLLDNSNNKLGCTSPRNVVEMLHEKLVKEVNPADDDAQQLALTLNVNTIDDDYCLLDKSDCCPDEASEFPCDQSVDDEVKSLSFQDTRLRLAAIFQLQLDPTGCMRRRTVSNADSPKSVSSTNASESSRAAAAALQSVISHTYSFVDTVDHSDHCELIADKAVVSCAESCVNSDSEHMEVSASSNNSPDYHPLALDAAPATPVREMEEADMAAEDPIAASSTTTRSTLSDVAEAKDEVNVAAAVTGGAHSHFDDVSSIQSEFTASDNLYGLDNSVPSETDFSSAGPATEACQPPIDKRHDDPADPHWKTRASSLPRTYLSDFLEGMVQQMLVTSGYPEAASSITIRMTSNCDHKMEVPRIVIDNLATAGGNIVPEYMGYRQKCILLFQAIDGVDVCLFCLYVQEFDASCPAPNTNTVYIAYLDSVDYFRPMEARTLVYQEIVVAYLKWSQSRGFKSAHIWSCPPQRGDNFIFWCHPLHQRTPSRERLNSWYNSILFRSLKLGFVSEISSLYDVFLSEYNTQKKEETQHRAAAKNSFVGTGRVVPKIQQSGSTANLPKNKSKHGNSTNNLMKAKLAAAAAATSTAPSSAPETFSVPADPVEVQVVQVPPLQRAPSESTFLTEEMAAVVLMEEEEGSDDDSVQQQQQSEVVAGAVSEGSTAGAVQREEPCSTLTTSHEPLLPVVHSYQVASFSPPLSAPLSVSPVLSCEDDDRIFDAAMECAEAVLTGETEPEQVTFPLVFISSPPLLPQGVNMSVQSAPTAQTAVVVALTPVQPVEVNSLTEGSSVSAPAEAQKPLAVAADSTAVSTAALEVKVEVKTEITATAKPPPAPLSVTVPDQVPICLPVFEGDYWLLEFARIWKQSTSKTVKHVGSASGHMDPEARKQHERQNNMRKCREYLKNVGNRVNAQAFVQPVDPEALGIPTYFQVISKPMAISTVKEQLRANMYPTMLEFAKDVRLIFSNAMLFNPPGHYVHTQAQLLLKDFHTQMSNMIAESGVATSTPTVTTPVVSTAGSTHRNSRSSDSISGTDTMDLQLAKFQLVAPYNLCTGSLPATTSNEDNVSNTASNTPRPTTTSGSTTSTPRSALTATPGTGFNLMGDSNSCNLISSRPNFERRGSDCMEIDTAATSAATTPHYHNSYSQHHTPMSTVSSAPSSAFSFEFRLEEDGDGDNLSTGGHNRLHSSRSQGGNHSYRKRTFSRTFSEDNSVCSGLEHPGDCIELTRGDSFDSSYSHGTIGSHSTGPVPYFQREVRRRDSMDSICSSSYVDNGTLVNPHDTYLRPFSHLNSSASYANFASHVEQHHQEQRHTPVCFDGQQQSQSQQDDRLQQQNQFNAALFNESLELRSFDKPPLVGFKTATSIMHELSKSAQRLKDDLFVIRFTSPLTVSSPTSAITNANNNSNSSGGNGSSGAVVKTDGEFQVPAPKRHRGRAAVYIKKAGPKFKPSETIPESCLVLLRNLRTDTSDPDPVINSPFVNSRHTFLEMCQYRHYQFDSLRRAKHSSLMLIYHLQNPFDKTTRIQCNMCRGVVRTIRWHCDQCPDYDICNACSKMSQGIGRSATPTALDSSSATCIAAANTVMHNVAEAEGREKQGEHPHPLTPFRVSYY